jgi:hypothetical protein
MQRYNSYKEDNSGSAMLVALLLLIFSCALIFIFTWFLFKDYAEDGKIGITVTTGKVKVDIVDLEDNSLVGDVLDFVDPDGDGKIYFEPGMGIRTEGFKIKNIGTTSLNFRLSPSDDDSLDMEEFKEAFEFWITTDPDHLDKLDSLDKLTSFKGQLQVDEYSETYYLVIRMKESAGNEFQNKVYTGIGVTVTAFQGSAVID